MSVVFIGIVSIIVYSIGFYFGKEQGINVAFARRNRK